MTAREALLAHARRCPLLTPQDAVKFLYQSEFGPGHFAPSPTAALSRLLKELSGVTQKNQPLFEEIGDGLCRVHLRAIEAHGVAPEELCRWFTATANAVRGDAARFAKKLQLLEALARGGALPFDAAALAAYFVPYRAAGCPAVHHSEVFRAAYHPAYRVVFTRLAAKA